MVKVTKAKDAKGYVVTGGGITRQFKTKIEADTVAKVRKRILKRRSK